MNKMNQIYRFLSAIHLFVGIGALAGGLAAMLNPVKPLGMSTDFLKNSPFHNYFIPGIILFALIGLGNVFSWFTFRYKLRYQGYISSVFSWALVIWIVVQCIMLNGIGVLHIIYFTIGLIEAFLSLIIMFDQHIFPTNLVLILYKDYIKKER